MDRLELDRPEPDRLELDRPESDRRTGPGPDPDRTRTRVTTAEQRLPIMDHGSWIKDHGPWTLFWHEWPSWTGYRREIKNIRIYYQRSIILYRFYKDPIKYPASCTLF